MPIGVVMPTVKQLSKKKPKPPHAAVRWIKKNRMENASIVGNQLNTAPISQKPIICIDFRERIVYSLPIKKLMPAIQLERLLQQIKIFLDPSLSSHQFSANLIELLEAHANLSYRAGTEIQVKNIIQSYKPAPLVIYHIQNKLTKIAQNHPQQALLFADQIWQHDFFETKQMAAVLIGALPVENFSETSQRLETWFHNTADKQIRYQLLQLGSANIRKNNLKDWLQIIQDWVNFGDLQKIHLGINAIEILAEDKSFENYPVIYAITNQIVEQKKDNFTNILIKIYQSIISRAPNETAYFLQHSLLSAPTEQKIKFIRRCINFFPPEQQKKLRSASKT